MLDEVNNPEMLDEVAMDMFLFCINQQAAENDQLPKHFCPDCNIKIYSSYIFIKRAKEHGNESKTKIKPEVIEKLIKDNALNKNNLRQCPVCDKTYKWQNRLITHLVREHSMDVKSMEQYACPYCPLIFISSDSLRCHKEKVHNEDRQFGCNACDKRFRKRAQLAVHALSHSEDRPFICDTCHMSFKLKDVLIKHLTVHESDRPFLCEICAKGFKKAGTLKDHMLTHAGARKTFVIKSALNRHMRIHTGEKPCKCPSCPLAFVDHWKRKMHIMRVHQVPFEEIPRLAADGQPLDKW
ncbi:zinc-finger double domain-containing protein [Phthorimaea operculella]|nr:zinc-finger double domain-containing protein [Phthorimaea operculella]